MKILKITILKINRKIINKISRRSMFKNSRIVKLMKVLKIILINKIQIQIRILIKKQNKLKLQRMKMKKICNLNLSNILFLIYFFKIIKNNC